MATWINRLDISGWNRSWMLYCHKVWRLLRKKASLLDGVDLKFRACRNLDYLQERDYCLHLSFLLGCQYNSSLLCGIYLQYGVPAKAILSCCLNYSVFSRVHRLYAKHCLLCLHQRQMDTPLNSKLDIYLRRRRFCVLHAGDPQILGGN